MIKKIIFTGGGTAGHITPNIPLIEDFKRLGWDTSCIILGNDMEKKLLEPLGVKLHQIDAGKLRRYYHYDNLVDLFKVFKGIIEASIYMWRLKPDVIFSKGGYIALPVAIGAWLNRTPFIIHESDIIPSLTTRLTYPFTNVVCTGFPPDPKFRWKVFGINIKTTYTGIPIRKEFLKLDIGPQKQTKRPTLLVIGGSLGASNINIRVREKLNTLLKHFNVVHICGEGKIDRELMNTKNYQQYEFVKKGIEKIIQKTDLVITRGGATFLYELLFLKKPMLIIPLSKHVSRGEQISNAQFFKSNGFGDFISEESLTPEKLVEKLLSMQKNLKHFRENMKNTQIPNSNQLIKNIIFEAVGVHK